MNLLDKHLFPFINDLVLGPAVDPIRAEVAAGARGAILEIGAGSGLNARHYAPGARVVGVEPAEGMRLRADKRVRASNVRADVRVEDGRAEALPFDAGAFDTVVFTFVLCSVRNIAPVLAEARRVLRPGGALRLAEHVKSPEPSVAAWQARLRPIWMVLLGGCDPTREIKLDLERAGFDPTGVRDVLLPLPPLARAGVVGEAIRL